MSQPDPSDLLAACSFVGAWAEDDIDTMDTLFGDTDTEHEALCKSLAALLTVAGLQQAAALGMDLKTILDCWRQGILVGMTGA